MQPILLLGIGSTLRSDDGIGALVCTNAATAFTLFQSLIDFLNS
jgi:Ni,Fe-hydrogenase maturation factor